MKKPFFIISFGILFCLLSVLPVVALEVFQKYDKVIVINQHKQIGAAYEGGVKIMEFPVLTGDDETTTDPGTYMVRRKDDSYYSRKYDTWMPLSLFFDLKNMKAIHEGEVPSSKVRKDYASHGCIHVESPYIERLYDWAEVNNTVVVIQGPRDGD